MSEKREVGRANVWNNSFLVRRIFGEQPWIQRIKRGIAGIFFIPAIFFLVLFGVIIATEDF